MTYYSLANMLKKEHEKNNILKSYLFDCSYTYFKDHDIDKKKIVFPVNI